MPTTGWFSFMPPVEPRKCGVAEGEDAAVRGDEPVAVARRRRGHADDRLVQSHGARRAEERASPKVKMPPSAATSHRPRPDGVAAIPTTGAFSSIDAGMPPTADVSPES